MFIEFKTKDKTYNLRLTTLGVTKLEEALGENPLTMMMGLKSNSYPKISQLMEVLKWSLPEQKSIEETYEIYDKWVEAGHNLTEFIMLVTQLYQQCGLIPSDKERKN